MFSYNSFKNVFIYFWPQHAACGILVPPPGIEPAPPAVEAQALNFWTTRGVPYISNNITFVVYKVFSHSFSTMAIRVSHRHVTEGTHPRS